MEDNKIELDKIRTAMSNERTFLAYLRTALSFWAFGLLIIRFFPENTLYTYAGTASLVVGAGMFFFGINSYIHRKKKFSA